MKMFDEHWRYMEDQAIKHMGEIQAKVAMDELRQQVETLALVIDDMGRRAGRAIDIKAVIAHSFTAGMLYWAMSCAKPEGDGAARH